MSRLLDEAARTVLAAYPLLSPSTHLVPLGNHGGFSGACLWRVEGIAGRWCLRAWPPGRTSAQALQTVHGWMAAAAGLPFVPRVLATAAGPSHVEAAGRLWDLATWMLGRADFHNRPGRRRLKAACTALAQLHQAWAATASAWGPCPAVERRLACVREWGHQVDAGWRPLATVSAGDPVRPWVERAWSLLGCYLPQVPDQLAPWTGHPLPLQPCLCDVWHDHVLFTGDAVTGVVDYGAAKVDHVAVDLARLLGSLVGDHPDERAAGLRAYNAVRPLTGAEERLVAVLDTTGTVLALANWLTWLYADGRAFANRAAVAGRLGQLVERVQGWRGAGLA